MKNLIVNNCSENTINASQREADYKYNEKNIDKNNENNQFDFEEKNYINIEQLNIDKKETKSIEFEYEINTLSKIENEKIHNLNQIKKKKNTNKLLVDNYEITKNIGLTNIGHIYYMNSFLQILLHTPNFLPQLKKYCKNNIEKDKIIYNLMELSENPYDTKYLYEIKKIISKTFPQYGPFVQNDSQIFAIDFIDTIISEIKDEKSYLSESFDEKEEIIKSEEENKIIKMSKFNKFKSDCEKTGEKTFIEDLYLLSDSTISYVGKLINPKRIKFDLQLNIELNFPHENLNDNYTLYELLDIKYTNSNKNISNKYSNLKENPNENTTNRGFYEKCKNIFCYLFNYCFKDYKNNNNLNQEIEKKIESKSILNNEFETEEISKIASLSEILIISINRGIEGKKLISSLIHFDDILELKNYIDEDLYDYKLGTSYKLFAINIREGSSKSSGHCYCYVKVENDWICFNDSQIHDIKSSFSLRSVVGLYYVKENLNKKYLKYS